MLLRGERKGWEDVLQHSNSMRGLWRILIFFFMISVLPIFFTMNMCDVCHLGKKEIFVLKEMV